MSFVIKNWVFYLLQFSLSILCAAILHTHTNKKKSSLITEAWNKEIPQLCMALEVTFFSPSFLSLNLCMSLWFHCSRTAVQRQSYTKRWNEKAVWGDIESQVNSTPGTSTELKMFSTLLNPSSVSRCCGKRRRGDGKSKPRYSKKSRPPAWTGAWFRVKVSVREGANADMTPISRRLYELADMQLVALFFTPAQFD